MTTSAQTEETILVTHSPAPGVQVLRLNRPGKLNALNLALLRALHAALMGAEADGDVRCVILTGAGRAFCAGADIADLSAGIAAYENPSRLAAQCAVSSFSKPLLSAVNGLALGGGLELALASDIVLASEDATFGLPEINLGAFPGDGGTQRLPRTCSKTVAMQMILTGESLTAAEAVRVGLASEVTRADALLPRATHLASLIAAKSPLAVMRAKQAVLQAFEMPLSAGLAFERTATAAIFATADRAEATRAYAEKRSPRFTRM